MGNRVGEEEIDVEGLPQAVALGRRPRGRWAGAVRGKVDPRITGDGRPESSTVGYAPLAHSREAN